MRKKLLFTLLFTIFLSACGQKGPLTLPESEVQSGSL